MGVRQNPLFPNQSRIAVVMIFECCASKIPPTTFDFIGCYPRPHGRGYQCYAPMGLQTFGGYAIDDLRLAISEEKSVSVIAPIVNSWILSYTQG